VGSCLSLTHIFEVDLGVELFVEVSPVFHYAVCFVSNVLSRIPFGCHTDYDSRFQYEIE
ncbi:MAG: hypothetical protein ACI8RD_008804, partial [Bacillariaceae sp.]|jgi:hypothetical protein